MNGMNAGAYRHSQNPVDGILARAAVHSKIRCGISSERAPDTRDTVHARVSPRLGYSS